LGFLLLLKSGYRLQFVFAGIRKSKFISAVNFTYDHLIFSKSQHISLFQLSFDRPIVLLSQRRFSAHVPDRIGSQTGHTENLGTDRSVRCHGLWHKRIIYIRPKMGVPFVFHIHCIAEFFLLYSKDSVHSVYRMVQGDRCSSIYQLLI